MEHPGVKKLLDRILKQNGTHVNTSHTGALNEQVKLDANINDGLEIVFDNQKKQQQQQGPRQLHKKTDEAQSANAFTSFKENLKARMKARRQEMRKEEEEDDKMDEEYHGEVNRESAEEEEESDVEEGGNYKQNKVDDSDEDEKATTTSDNDKKSSDNEESDDDDNFQLNLNEDDDADDVERSESELVLLKKQKKDFYEFDEDTCDQVDSLDAKKTDSIPLTNTIPSNQPKGDFDFDSQEYLEGTQFLIDKQQRRSLDEITNISFNYEATQQQASGSANQHNLSSGSLKSKAGSSTNLTAGEDDFDELAMLCSGQFKEAGESSPVDLSKLIEKESTQGTFVNLENKDLYEANEPEPENAVIHAIPQDDRDSDEEKEVEKEEVIGRTKKALLLSEDEDEEPVAFDDGKKKNEERKKKKETTAFDKMVGGGDSSEKVEIDEEEEEGEEESVGENFFEEEAELSGSEQDPDENDEGDSGEDDSIVFSGDESELPGADQLKEQLGKIFLKDQIDEDKRQIRMFKEMYLGEEENESKENRRKQFRWKNADSNFNSNNRFSSDEEEDDEDDEDEEDQKATENGAENNRKNEKYMKLMETRNWRMVRHEREQFVKQKTKAETLLSDEEEPKVTTTTKKKLKKIRIGYKTTSHDNDDDSEDTEVAEDVAMATSSTKSIFKMGQNLLKKKTPACSELSKSEQSKRALNGEINAVSRLNTITSKTSISITGIRQTSESDSTTTKTNLNRTPDNLLKKLSFLSRDKGYLSKLSSYVNKNFNGLDTAIGTSTAVKSAATKAKLTNGMVFTKIDLTVDEEVNGSGGSGYVNSSEVNRQSAAINSRRTEGDRAEFSEVSKISITPTSKRVKLDTCESIFNHIN